MNNTAVLSNKLKNNWIYAIPYIMLIVLTMTSGIINPNTLKLSWFANSMDSGLMLVLVSIGQTIVLLIGGFDLSVGGVMCVTNCFAALYLGDTVGSVILGSVACLLFGILIGTLNGYTILKTGMQPFIVTLVVQSICYGVALLLLKVDGGRAPDQLMDFFIHRFGPIPVSFIILVLLIGTWLWIKRTSFGIALYAVGSNEVAARLNGINVTKVKISAYAACGFFAALAGLYRTAQVGSGSPTAGSSYVMLSIAAAVVGGTALGGGKGGILGTIAGAFVLRNIADVLIFLKVSSYWTSLVQGALLIFAVALGAYYAMRKQKR